MKNEINESITWWHNRFNAVEKQNNRLRDLCDKRENERLTQGVTLLTNKLIDMTKEKEDYKSRNEKAIEYNKKNIKSKTLNDILQEGEK